MEGFAAEGKSVGLILDVSLRHTSDGRRVIDTVKDQIVSVIRGSFEEEVDSMYLFHPYLFETLRWNGERMAAVFNYETDGRPFNVASAMRQTLYVVGAEDIDDRKYVLIVTDRLSNRSWLEKGVYLNRKDAIDAHITVIGIGDDYDRGMVDEVLRGTPSAHISLADPSDLCRSFTKGMTNGEEPEDL